VEFDDELDAEDAKKDLNGQDMGGLKINIGKQSLSNVQFLEWSKKSKNFDPNSSTRPARRE
jgi:hypothetical protein